MFIFKKKQQKPEVRRKKTYERMKAVARTIQLTAVRLMSPKR